MQKTIKFPADKGYDIESITLRETTGLDEHKAAALADAKGASTTVTTEMVRLSIVSVNGEKVVQPYGAFDTWKTRTRQAIMTVYTDMNLLTEEDQEGLEITSS